jgi:hypothetical protein
LTFYHGIFSDLFSFGTVRHRRGNASGGAPFKSTQSTQNMSKESGEGARNTCLSELKSKNVTVDKFRAVLVHLVGQRRNFNILESEK